MKTLFLAWQDTPKTRAWYPIGRLEADREKYLFTYVGGAKRAAAEAGLRPLLAFPDFDRRYESDQLFMLFRNRVPSPEREDFQEYLKPLNLDPAHVDAVEILSVSGGRRHTDNLEVFPKIIKQDSGRFSCRFFLHGWRRVSRAAQEQIATLTQGEPLRLAVEFNNPATGKAIQIQSADYQVLGWTPRYLVDDLLVALQSSEGVALKVAKVNDSFAPIPQRVLIDLEGQLPEGYEPMSGKDFEPICVH